MKLTLNMGLGVLAGSGVFALALLMALVLGSPFYAVALPIGIAVGGLVVLYPFIGLLLICLFAQMDALANILFQGLPISGVKVLTFLTFAGVIFDSVRKPRSERFGPNEPILYYIVLFALVIVLSSLFVEDRSLAIWSARRLLPLMLLSYLAVRLIETRRQVEMLIICIVASSLGSSFVVIFDYLFGGNLLSSEDAAVTAGFGDVSRSSGASDYNPTTAATMLLAGTCMAMMMFIESPKWRWLAGPTILLGTGGLILSFARSAAVVFAISVLVLLFTQRRHKLFPLVIMTGLLGLTTVAVLLYAGVPLPFIPPEYVDRLLTLLDFNSDYTLWRRFGYNLIGVDLLVQHPILGVGPGNFQHWYTDPDYRWIPGRTLLPRQLHNMYLEVAVETGLIGFACFMAIIGSAVRGLMQAARRADAPEFRWMGRSMLFGFGAFLLASVFVPNEYQKYLWLLSGIAVALGRLSRLPEPEPAGRRALDTRAIAT
jgi:O-antigen ligase